MSQHDMNIGNGPGLAVRTDLNAALQALASSNSGPSAPNPTFPCQLWADTGTGRQFRRNSDNTAWLDMGPIDANLREAANDASFAVGAGAVNAYTATFTPAVIALVDGLTLNSTVITSNTGASTFSPNGLAAKPILTPALAALSGGELVTNSSFTVKYSASLNAWLLLTATNASVGRGFIEGLAMRWVSATSIQIDPGSCWINSLNRVYKVPAVLTVTPPAGVTGFGHIYVYDNAGTPAAEMVTTDQEIYWGNARQKTGDNTRRYIGSVLLNSASGAYKFRHHPELSKINYLVATPAASPFIVLNGGSATSFTAVSAANVTPSSAIELITTVVPAAQDAVFGNEEQATAGAVSNWLQAARAGSQQALTLAFSLANTLRRFTYAVAAGAGGNLTIYATGYTFGR